MLSIVKSKIFNFFIQILLLSIIIFSFEYQVSLNLDGSLNAEREWIIQTLANYILYDYQGFNFLSILFIYSSWLGISLIPIIIFREPIKAYSINLTTLFFPSFFFYVFLNRYSPDLFEAHFWDFFNQTIILAVVLAVFSILVSLGLKMIFQSSSQKQSENFERLVAQIRTKCPHCGTEFESKPKYCYNCSKEIAIIQNNSENLEETD